MGSNGGHILEYNNIKKKPQSKTDTQKNQYLKFQGSGLLAQVTGNPLVSVQL